MNSTDHRSRRPAPLAIILLGALGLLSLVGCRDAEQGESSDSRTDAWSDLPTLEIIRSDTPPTDPALVPPPEPVADGNGMRSINLSLPPTFLSAGASSPGKDPFGADDPQPVRPAVPSAQGILERAGVDFPDGAFAHYDPATGLLTVRNTPNQIEMVEAYTESIGQGPIPLLTCRAEIFDLPTAAALDLQRLADEKTYHDAERRAVIEACRRGEARFVAGVDLPAMSGQRARTDSTSDYLVTRDFEKAENTDTLVPQFEWHRSGMRMEVDPIINASETHIDLHLTIEHATAEPTSETTSTVSADGTQTLPLEVPVFSQASIKTQVTLVSGTSKLVGVFPVPNSGATDTGPGRSRLVFVQAWVRRR